MGVCFLMCFGSFSVKSRPRSKHSSFSCFHAFMILPENSPKTSKNTHPWKHEKDECFCRGLDFTKKPWKYVPPSRRVLGPKTDPKMGPRAAQNWLPFWSHFWSNFGVAFGSFWVPSEPQDWPGRGPEEPKRAKWSSKRPKRQLSKKCFSHRTVCIFSLLRLP